MLAPRSPLLLANRPAEKYPTIAFDNLTQQRRFFDPRVIYQDADALLVAVAPTAKPNSPSASTWPPAVCSGAAQRAPTTFKKLCTPPMALP